VSDLDQLLLQKRLKRVVTSLESGDAVDDDDVKEGADCQLAPGGALVGPPRVFVGKT